jgi:hypothetical protein
MIKGSKNSNQMVLNSLKPSDLRLSRQFLSFVNSYNYNSQEGTNHAKDQELRDSLTKHKHSQQSAPKGVGIHDDSARHERQIADSIHDTSIPNGAAN